MITKTRRDTTFIARTALHKASFFSTALSGLALCALLSACGLGPDPDADGARFNKRFNYFYSQTCRYDKIGAYDCEPISSLSAYLYVGLRVDHDGFASLNLDGDRYYYMESEYDEGYDLDYGGYFHFYQDTDELTIYKDGSEMALWDTDQSFVTYYFHDLY